MHSKISNILRQSWGLLLYAYCYKKISQYVSWPQNINMFNVNNACFNENKVQIDTGMLLCYEVESFIESVVARMCASPAQPTARVHSTEQASSRPTD